MAIDRIDYQAGETACTGALVYDQHVSGPRPLLLISPNWLGVSDDSIKRAATIAGSKYVAFVADMYGGGKIPAGPPEAGPLANALRADGLERRRRIAAALDALRSESAKRKIGDLKRQAAVGFCFGGGNVLELARAGADLQAVICLHGDLLTPLPAKPGDIKAAICVMHGAKDPVVPKHDRDVFEAEMEAQVQNGRCRSSAACCIRSARLNPTCRGSRCFDPGAARQSYHMIDDFATAAFAGKL